MLARSARADESRKQRRYFAFLEKFTWHRKSETVAGNDNEADERLHVMLGGQLASLPEDERRLVEQKYILHQSVREIADRLQTTEKAVESKLSRVRRKLKEAMLAELKSSGSGSLR